ncbi:MAG TPA: branched-chain amino acid ABC transporter permease [Anaerolineales bacterium]|nr:branched-chain amino acid ABC transporter permease [Anaerolineales bacterium]
MAVTSETIPTSRERLGLLKTKISAPFVMVPILGWLFGALVAVSLEQLIGLQLARALGMPRIPALFGIVIALQKPELIPSAILYDLLIYVLPILLAARLIATPSNWFSAKMFNFRNWFSVLFHLLLLYFILHLWSDINDYRLLVVRLILVAIIITLSLNLINGYMGEFSCSHPGFIALGAYGASVFTVGLFVNDNILGAALLPESLGRFLFPIGLLIGGVAASLGAILVAVPSFKTRGDYLAIISLAFMFMVKSLFENLEVVGGSRGLGGQPDWATLPTVFLWTILGIWIMNNFVRSTLGKALNAVRDGEIAADAMTVNTRRTKFVAFLFGAFWAGVAGGLFAHVIRYVNPSTFGIQMLAEVLAMVYFGGLNSVQGSIVGALSINLLSEALRPLEIYKWLVIPLLLIIVMITRPTGLISFTEFDFTQTIKPKQKPEEGV